MATHSMGFFPPYSSSSSAYVDDPATLAQPLYYRKALATESPVGPWAESPNVDASTDAGSDRSASSPPASDDGMSAYSMHLNANAPREDWDLLSEMLIDDASMNMQSASFLGGHAFPKPAVYAPSPPPFVSPPTMARPMAPGFMDALLQQDDALLAARAKASSVTHSPQTTDHVFPPPPSSSSESEVSPNTSPRLTKRNRKVTAVKTEPLTAEEAKKQKRRSQIASSVQRHREKKKCLVANLKTDLASLTEQLESLRSERKALHAHNETLVAWEEEAMTQRRKRKQTEELNERLKKALFQQTCFLMGMRTIMTNVPAPRELHIHDWLHSYTVLTARDRAARHKEYAALFSDSKVDMARQIVLRETDVFATRVTLSNPYFSEIRVLHDGTDVLHNEADVVVPRELQNDTVPGLGQVVKKYTSMFLFPERGACTLEAFRRVALEATKAVGVFWPSPGYQSHALETMALDDSSQVIFSDLHGAMSMIDNADGDVTLEARMLARVVDRDDDSTIAWDYADKDELYPIDGAYTIRRDSCGAAIVRREPGGLLSFRSVCVKTFGPLDSHATAASDVRARTQRRISLQASELERQNQKCTRSVYESLAAAFTTTR